MELLEEAIIAGNSAEVSCLLSAGVSVNAHFHSGTTPLNLAVSSNHPHLVEELVSQWKADPRRPDSLRYDGCCRRPIHYAAACDSLPVVQMLVSHGVPLDEPDFGNATSLHHAAVNGNMGRAVFQTKRNKFKILLDRI